MSPKLRSLIKRWAYPIAGVLAGIAEVIRQDPEFYTRSWQELLDRGLKALPVVLFGLVARRMLFKKDDDDQKPAQQD